MTFRSILSDDPDFRASTASRVAPDFFIDLNLDQVVTAITAGRQEYDLAPFFYTPLHNLDTIGYRQEVLRDLGDKALRGRLESFARQMRAMREHLSRSRAFHYRYQQETWFVDAARIYCAAARELAHELAGTELRSRGMRGFREYLAKYTGSAAFAALMAETEDISERLSQVSYTLRIRQNSVEVRKDDSDEDYSADVLATFEKFKRGAARDYRVRFTSHLDMDHVEAGILDLVAKLYPETFSALSEFCARHRGYLDQTIADFDREIQFYLAFLQFTAVLGAAGLEFCYPEVQHRCTDVSGQDVFDVALASKLAREGTVVRNDFQLTGPERIIVVTGPNQGGKTTFARTFGQLHHLASIGCLVPGSHARLTLPDRVFTHFERGENLEDLRSKLEDDLIRIRHILDAATEGSVIIMNEIFTSTTLQDAVFLGTRVLEDVIKLGALCVCVTFADELAALSEATVSMMSTVQPDNPAVRTFKVERKPADGLAHAVAIASQHGLSYRALKERIGS